jgi:hypothetical protein
MALATEPIFSWNFGLTRTMDMELRFTPYLIKPPSSPAFLRLSGSPSFSFLLLYRSNKSLTIHFFYFIFKTIPFLIEGEYSKDESPFF